MKRSLFLVYFSSFAFASQPNLTYEPTIVELAGTLDIQTFPGPPNYESIADGDEIERHFYLKLDTPIEVVPPKNNTNAENSTNEQNVKILQLAINGDNDALWAQFRKLGRGKRAKVTGTLFHRFTGHHHSRVLLLVQKIKATSLRTIQTLPSEKLLR